MRGEGGGKWLNERIQVMNKCNEGRIKKSMFLFSFFCFPCSCYRNQWCSCWALYCLRVCFILNASCQHMPQNISPDQEISILRITRRTCQAYQRYLTCYSSNDLLLTHRLNTKAFSLHDSSKMTWGWISYKADRQAHISRVKTVDTQSSSIDWK